MMLYARAIPFLGLGFAALRCTAQDDAPSSARAGRAASGSSSSSAVGGGSAGSGGAVELGGQGGGDAAFPAIHPPIPSAVYHGGSILESLGLFTVVFEGDPYADDIVAFDSGITMTPWWTAITAEYCEDDATTSCIGKGHDLGSVTLPPPSSTLTDADVHALIQDEVTLGSLPDPDPQNVYAFYFPNGITVIEPGGGKSCTAFHAYHEFAPIHPKGGGAAVVVPYIVVTRCPDADSVVGATLLGSHELVEAATDPFLNGFSIDDLAWAATHGGELCDVCLYSGATSEGAWSVERGFSNAAAAKGESPCVPSDGDVDFNLAPPDGNAKIELAVGATATLDLVGYSSGPLADWSVKAVNSGSGSPLSLTLDRTTVNNGVSAKLTVTLKSAPFGGVAPFMIQSTRGSREHFWPGVVVAQ